MRRNLVTLGFIVFISFLMVTPSIAKSLLDTKVVFQGNGKAKVSVNAQGQPATETATNKIQATLMFYAFAMNRIADSQRSNLMNQAQRVVSQIATETGLKRPNVIKHNKVVKSVAADSKGKGFELSFNSLHKGNSLDVKLVGDSAALLGPAVFYVFQETINTIPEGGLRLFALSLGGMNKWYREKGKATDSNSVSQAPAYGLNLALDLISKISGKNI